MSKSNHATDLPAIGAPATRALAAANITQLKQLTKISAAELLKLHGVGPKAVRILTEALAQRGLSFADATKISRLSEQANQRIPRRATSTPPAKSAAVSPARSQAVDDYLARLSEDKRAALEALRSTIQSIVPKAEEYISYQLPAFRLEGKPLVAFGATGKHCAFYLMSASTVAAHQAELAGYDTSKGTIRFQADRPLPKALVRKLVKARIAENLNNQR